MKSANVRQLRHQFSSVIGWVEEGEAVEIVKKGKVIALLTPPPKVKKRKLVLPNFAERQKKIFGDRVLPGNIVAEERQSYRW